MYISKFEVRNYKSYRAPGALELKPGFNIITGQNNAGKTSLLESLSCRFSYRPHRSEITVPTPGAEPVGSTLVRATFVISRDELTSQFVQAGNYFVPRPINAVPYLAHSTTHREPLHDF